VVDVVFVVRHIVQIGGRREMNVFWYLQFLVEQVRAHNLSITG
jgi:hypothetical protein